MKKIVISLGGSLIYPTEIDTEFISGFKQLIEEYITKEYHFIIYCGGGKLARNFQDAAEKIAKLNDEKKDWLGIEATKINSFFIKSLFAEESVHEEIISDPRNKIISNKPILICSGWKPGWSTDYVAVLAAKESNSHVLINMSNINYVYDSDPKKNKDAKPLKYLAWKQLRELVGNVWKPGLNMPFDPIAAKEAEKYNLKVIIIGNNLENLKKVLDEEQFEGTTIQ